MKRHNIFLIFLGILILYAILINLFAGFISASNSNSDDELILKLKGQETGIGVDMGVGESVSISVVRNRFYGKIVEYSSGNKMVSYVYLLRFIRLPLRIGGINFIYLHLLALALIIFLFIFVRRKIYKDEFSL